MQTQQAAQPQRTPIHWPSVWQLGLSLFGVISLWGIALATAATGLVQYFNRADTWQNGLSLLLMAAGLAFSGALLLPSAGYALARLMGRPDAPGPRLWRPLPLALVILIVPLVLLAGDWVSQIRNLAWLVLPGLHVLGIGLPVLWLATISRLGITTGSRQLAWGVFGSGLVLGPAIILAAELAALAGFVILGAIWIASQPDLAAEITRLAERLSSEQLDPEEVVQLLQPYLTRPPVMYAFFVFGAGIVPLIEEAAKPIGVWLLAGRSISPAEGFAAGVLSGAGYALFESLALASSTEEWATLVFARSGTAVIHILTTGLTGWALVLAWREGRYLRLALAYLAAVGLHGLWNAVALSVALTEIVEMGDPAVPALLRQAVTYSPYALAGLTILGLAGLLALNRTVRRHQQV